MSHDPWRAMRELEAIVVDLQDQNKKNAVAFDDLSSGYLARAEQAEARVTELEAIVDGYRAREAGAGKASGELLPTCPECRSRHWPRQGFLEFCRGSGVQPPSCANCGACHWPHQNTLCHL